MAVVDEGYIPLPRRRLIVDIHEHPDTLQLFPELRRMKPNEANLFVLTELLAAVRRYTKE